MHPPTAVQYVLWLLAPTLQAVIVAAMMFRRLYREFPVFFCYTVYHVVQVPLALGSYHHSYHTYFVVYWVTEVIDAVLELFILQEIFLNVFREYEGLRTLGVMLFRWATLVLIGIALIAAAAAPGTDSVRAVAGFLVLQRSARIVETGLLLLLFAFCRAFGLSWRPLAFGIALGFSMYATLGAVAAALHTQLGAVWHEAYSYVLSCVWNLAIGVWVYYSLFPHRIGERLELPSSSQLVSWNQALRRLLGT